MKVNRILKPSEVDAIVREASREHQPRQADAVTDKQIAQLNIDLELAPTRYSLKDRPQPIATGEFGDVYDVFRQRAMDAAIFLYSQRSGEAKGVFSREEIGEISLIWGDRKKGLEHIINKHIINHSDFNSVEDMLKVVQSVIERGVITQLNNGNYQLTLNGNLVVIAKTPNSDFVLTAYDTTRSAANKKKKHCGCDTF